uniref:Tc1-like transposase DDE domain-containing protein n=1 Tax=Denticeps clupeoides TaxID=299321 RepID=A0AAY4BWC2_9TELE
MPWRTFCCLQHPSGRPCIFQQDIARPHSASVTTSWLRRRGIRVLKWPSPDLNPIQMVWGELDRRLKAKGPTSAKHLWELLQDCWKTISGEDVLKPIERMPRVCKAVIRAKGGYFEETLICFQLFHLFC